MRLIDADALRVEFGISDSDIIAKETIDNAPTIDAVPVVRCRECKHWKQNLENDTYCSHAAGLSDPEEHDFCSYGQRKEADHA